jgi:MoaA/NifB/PqqE/SkfB family radical SAM enzyme
VYPSSTLIALDTLWLQVAGTLCNLACTHCFIACSPTNDAHGMMSLAEVARHLADAERLGVKEYYLTGGEPFLNREILPILEAILAKGPASVLTNGTLIRPETAARLRTLSDASEYSLDLRVSIDGWDAETNDAIRGTGTFEKILAGIRALAGVGLNPVLTVTEACAGAGTREGRARFLAFLRELGLLRPRLKILPLLRIGAEAARLRPYAEDETLAGVALTAADVAELQCSSSRMVTAKGVYVCPILIDADDACLGATLDEALGPFTLKHRACYTCHEYGLSCRT